MQTLSNELQAHLAAPVTTLAMCWRIQRIDGVVLGFTQHDRAMELGGVAYSPAPAFSVSAIERTMTTAVDNLDVDGVFASHALTDQDLELGRYDDAELKIFRVNWADLSMGQQYLASGIIGRVSRTDAGFTAELRGLKHRLQRQACEVYSPHCRARLGDHRCRVNLALYQHRMQVTGQTGPGSYQLAAPAPADGTFNFGTLRWLSGPLTGQYSVILKQTGTQIELDERSKATLSFPLDVLLTEGCDKRLATCRDRFNNVLNYRGEPYVPGLDSLLNYPGLG
ncbi:MAG: DUF2163 domain-containing protein [Pseudomonadota bacterium]